MQQKITVISFDHWNYDVHIVNALNKLGHDSTHVKIGNFKHKSLSSRIQNTFSKIFLGKNPKHYKRQEYILETLSSLGYQDKILVINPELIDLKYHLEIKKFTKAYIAYLYDSVARCPVDHLLKENVFDTIFSFDKDDCKNYNFRETSNYIYFSLEKQKTQNVNTDYIYIGSIDERLNDLEKIGDYLKSKNKTFKFYAIGKKAFVYNLKKVFTGKLNNIIFKRERFSQNETLELYKKSNTLIDIVRKDQSGLSFRIFEALGLDKNIITNNENVYNYDFYDNKKIQIIKTNNFDFLVFDNTLKNSYPKEIKEKYHINTWVRHVFNL